jgi:putative membrane protein
MDAAFTAGIAYCGASPDPATLASRFNLDPVLIVALGVVAVFHVGVCWRRDRSSAIALAGWSTAAAAVLSPLCALSVSLFAARVGQHMILALLAAPMIGAALPNSRWVETPCALWAASGAFFVFLWFWHMPAPYAATFASTPVYWTMHLTLFCSAIALWAALLRQHSVQALAAGTATSVQMGLLGAVICLAARPMYAPHFFTTEDWGLSPLADQQLGGALMWVPGCLLFLWVALRSFAAIWNRYEEAAA